MASTLYLDVIMQLSHVTIIVDDLEIENWKYSAMQEIANLDIIGDLSVINLNMYKDGKRGDVFPQNRVLRFIEKRLFHIEYDALEMKSITTLQVKMDVVKEVSSVTINTDLVVNLSERKIPDNIKLKSTYGVWRYFFSEANKHSSYQVGRSEYLDRKGHVTTGIVAENRGENSYILHQKKSALDHLSMCVGVENILWGCVSFIPMLIERLHLYGEAFTIDNKPLIDTDGATPLKIKNEGIIKECFICIKSYIRQIVVKFVFPCKWILLLDQNINTDKSSPRYKSIKQHKKLVPPRGKFWADPFLVNKEGNSYIFFEELEYKNWRGYISYIKVNKDNSYSEPTKVLERPYHLSYPFVFNYENEMYMIPESRENKTIELYHCENFPDKWTFKSNLMEGLEACDSTLLEYEEKWWMFTVVNPHEKCMNSEDLYIYYADSPLDDNWTAHKNNPVISDATAARPAGNFFTQNGKLYRPSQNCAGIYGKGLNINEVIELTTDTYEERKVYEDTADWSFRMEGVHTYNQTESLAVSDAQHYQLVL